MTAARSADSHRRVPTIRPSQEGVSTRRTVRRCALAGLAALALSLAATACAVAAHRRASTAPLPRLTVEEQLGLQRRGWPVSIGVPLPRGWTHDESALQLRGDGGVVPSQSRALARWPDGSVRWALISFAADLAARQTRRFEVQRGSPGKPRHPVSVRETADGIEIDTGALRFTIARRSFGLLQDVAVDGKPVASGPLTISVVAGGKRSVAAAPLAVTVEERGPLRAAVSLRGRLGPFEQQLRLYAYADQPFVRILHTFVNIADADFTTMSGLRLEMPLAPGEKAHFTAGVENRKELSGALPAGGTDLAQVDNISFRQGETPRPGQLSGWFEISAARAGVALDAPFFWQEYPQAVHLGGDRLAYDLWSEAGGVAKVGVGAAKTHELTLAFSPPGSGQKAVREAARGVLAHVDPSWLASSRAMLAGMQPPGSESIVADASRAFDRYVHSVQSERWDDSGQPQCPPPAGERPRTGFYGMFNWGDWNYPGYHDDVKGCDAWGNQEYDLTEVLTLLFAATGRADVHEYMVAAARHFTDVDRIHHYPPNPNWVGMNHPKNPLHFSFALGGVDPGHSWVEGLFNYYFLTGDQRARDGAVGIADFLARRAASMRRGNPRQFGWPALAMAAAWDATGKPEYRQAALTYAREGMAAHPAAGAVKNWKMGVLADGLAYVHAATGDQELRKWILAYAEVVVREQPKNLRFYPAVAYAGRLTGEERFREAARGALAGIKYDDWGKPFTIAARSAFRIETLLEEH